MANEPSPPKNRGGRPEVPDKRKIFSVPLNSVEKKHLQELAKKWGCAASEAARRAIREARQREGLVKDD